MLMFLSGISSSKTTSQYEDITDDSDHFEVQDMESSGASTGESAEDVINTDPPQSNARFAHYPIYTVGMIIVQLSLYIYGIYYLIGVNNVEYSRYQPISPPNRNLMFDTEVDGHTVQIIGISTCVYGVISLCMPDTFMYAPTNSWHSCLEFFWKGAKVYGER
eukprot:CAMPEP_0185035206 /NCGR_PEP_ID=MMETSP1103-20130426/26150_1 /TAXON_ID=36769 /ORGANISM="Paraphysomonas bandaiensis, Strain Caron Lab Isolate" /LENGTH=161 /DNA_ID=CAMNT_0027572179 /DNA_START=352 /DNA_END=838 /DNA_ORIENTATION=-